MKHELFAIWEPKFCLRKIKSISNRFWWFIFLRILFKALKIEHDDTLAYCDINILRSSPRNIFGDSDEKRTEKKSWNKRPDRIQWGINWKMFSRFFCTCLGGRHECPWNLEHCTIQYRQETRNNPISYGIGFFFIQK